MRIEFFKSALCPRCRLAAYALKKIKKEYPDIEIESIEMICNLDRFRQARVRSIPTIIINDNKLTGLFLTPAKIRNFITGNF